MCFYSASPDEYIKIQETKKIGKVGRCMLTNQMTVENGTDVLSFVEAYLQGYTT